MKRSRVALGCLVTVGALVLLAVIAARPALEGVARFLIVEDPIAGPVDVVAVLSGGEGERLRAAIDLWRAGTARAILLVGPDDPVLKVYSGEDSLTMGEAKRRIAVRKGVPEEAVFVSLGANSTFEEAETVRDACRARGWTRVAVATSPFHTRRARATFRWAFRGSGVDVFVVHRPLGDSVNDPHRWWRREDDTMAVLGEIGRLAYYAYRHRIGPW